MITSKNNPDSENIFASGSGNEIFELFKIFKSSFDALDRLHRPDRGGFLGTVLDNSFK